jgi:hypothetical protein
VLTLVGFAVAFWVGGAGWEFWMLPLVPILIVMTTTLLMAVVGAILAGRAVARGMGQMRDVVSLLAAGAAALISVLSLLIWGTEPAGRDYYICWYEADTLEQQNACDVAYNTSNWEELR